MNNVNVKDGGGKNTPQLAGHENFMVLEMNCFRMEYCDAQPAVDGEK